MTSQVGVSTCDDRSGSAGTAGPYRGDGSIPAHHPAQGEGHVGVRGGGEPLEAVEPVGPVRLGLAFSDVLLTWGGRCLLRYLPNRGSSRKGFFS